MDPVELAKKIEEVAKALLASAAKGGTELVPGLYETKERVRKAFADLETAVCVNSMQRKAAGFRSTDQYVNAATKQRAQELLKAGGGG